MKTNAKINFSLRRHTFVLFFFFFFFLKYLLMWFFLHTKLKLCCVLSLFFFCCLYSALRCISWCAKVNFSVRMYGRRHTNNNFKKSLSFNTNNFETAENFEFSFLKFVFPFFFSSFRFIFLFLSFISGPWVILIPFTLYVVYNRIDPNAKSSRKNGNKKHKKSWKVTHTHTKTTMKNKWKNCVFKRRRGKKWALHWHI